MLLKRTSRVLGRIPGAVFEPETVYVLPEEVTPYVKMTPSRPWTNSDSEGRATCSKTVCWALVEFKVLSSLSLKTRVKEQLVTVFGRTSVNDCGGGEPYVWKTKIRKIRKRKIYALKIPKKVVNSSWDCIIEQKWEKGRKGSAIGQASIAMYP